MESTPRLASAWGPLLLWAACIPAVALAAGAFAGLPIAAWALLATIIPIFGAVCAGTFLQASGIFGRPVLSASTVRAEVALTFDDGPDPASTPALLALLDARGHRATFFVIGERAARFPELVREIASRGHAIENHSWAHSYATPFATASRLLRELERASALIASASGRRPAYFRPPVGLLSPPVARAARLAKLQLVGWTATARDGVASTTPARAIARLRSGLHAGAILVMHDGAIGKGRIPIAAQVLPQLLSLLEARGLRSVTLAQLLASSSD